jgi:hypothetical protein
MEYPPTTERIRKLIDFYAHGSVRKFSQMIGLSSSQKLNRLFHLDKRNNKYPEPSSETIHAIVDKFDILNANWLFTGKGDMFLVNTDSNLVVSDSDDEYIKNSTDNSFKPLSDGRYKVSIPLVPAHAHARYVSDFCEDVYNQELEHVEFVVDQIGKGKYLAFEIKGDSMDDDSKYSIPDRSIVLCRDLQQDHWKNQLHLNKFPYCIIVHETSILCKQIIEHDAEKGIIKCHSLNPSPEYQDFEISLNEVKQLLNIVKIQKNVDLY